MENNTTTPFSIVFDSFFERVTDDMYMEFTKADTEKILQPMLMEAISFVEFPRQDLYNLNMEEECFNVSLTLEEINILSTYMIVSWMDRQLATIENMRQKYSGADFKMTSQANHMKIIKEVRREYERIGFHLQRLYKRRKKDSEGIMRSTFGEIMGESKKRW